MKQSIIPAFAAIVLLNISLSRGETMITKPVISEEACPVEVISAPTSDQKTATAVVRKPPGKGPFPALVYLHGGLEPRSAAKLKEQIFKQTESRFLAAGYVVVDATFRSRKEDMQTTDALVDCLGIIEYVKKMPEVDSKSVVIWGDSGGGSLALELAGETQLCAIAAQEPATVLMTGMFSKTNVGSLADGEEARAKGNAIMADPKKFYTPELQEFTRKKIHKISCPVFIAQGDKNPINKINNEIIIPELKKAGKEVEVILYPGENHGFAHGNGTPEAAKKFFEDCDAFFKRHLVTQPVPVDESLIQQGPIERKVKEGPMD